MRANKVDVNQKQIVTNLRYSGCSVQTLNAVKEGCPDILVGYQKKNYLFEIKDGSKPPSARKLTDDELLFHSLWRGQVCIVHNFADCMKAMGR